MTIIMKKVLNSYEQRCIYNIPATDSFPPIFRLKRGQVDFYGLVDSFPIFLLCEPIAKLLLCHSGESRNPVFSVLSGPRLYEH